MTKQNTPEQINAELLEAAKEWANWIDTLPGGLEQFEKWARKQDNWADAPLVSRLRAAIAKAEGRP